MNEVAIIGMAALSAASLWGSVTLYQNQIDKELKKHFESQEKKQVEKILPSLVEYEKELRGALQKVKKGEREWLPDDVFNKFADWFDELDLLYQNRERKKRIDISKFVSSIAFAISTILCLLSFVWSELFLWGVGIFILGFAVVTMAIWLTYIIKTSIEREESES